MSIRHDRSSVLAIATVLILGTAAALSADRVRLRSGKVVEGMFMGGDSKSVRFLLDSGTVSEIPLEEAVAVEFTARKPKPAPAAAPAAKAPAAAPAAAPAPAAARKTVSVPAGTGLNVRLTQAIDVDASKAGQTFKAIVDDP